MIYRIIKMTDGFGTKFLIQWAHGHGLDSLGKKNGLTVWQYDWTPKCFNTIEEARTYIAQMKVPVITEIVE